MSLNGPERRPECSSPALGGGRKLAAGGGYATHLLFAAGLCLVGFSVINIAGELFRPGFDANLLCLPVAPTAWWASRLLVGAATVFLGISLAWPLRKGWIYWSVQGLLTFMTLSALGAALGAKRQFFSNEISRVLPARYTVCVAAAIGSQIARVWLEQRNASAGVSRRISAWGTIGGVSVMIVAFMGAQFFLFGGTRREVRGDCAVVMGAGVHYDGSPTRPLAERTLAACNLYLAGRVQHLLLSGGPVYGSFTEPMSMRAFAVKHGVPRRAIALDEQGYSTLDTARNAKRIMAEKGWKKAVVVTHDYHLSRTWLTFRRAGINTVAYPAQRDAIHLRSDARVILRECAAWWYYFLRP